MGIFGELLGVAVQKIEQKRLASGAVEKNIIFDSDWEDSWNFVKSELAGGARLLKAMVVLPDEFLLELEEAIEGHKVTERIPYSEIKAPLNVVGESFRQSEIHEFCNGIPGEEMPWLPGFLLPEMFNEHDSHAVAVYVVKRTTVAEDPGTIPTSRDDVSPDDEPSPFECLHAGYMDRESAKKVHRKILNLLGKGQYAPLLIRINGGTKDKPNYGVQAYAMTEKIPF